MNYSLDPMAMIMASIGVVAITILFFVADNIGTKSLKTTGQVKNITTLGHSVIFAGPHGVHSCEQSYQVIVEFELDGKTIQLLIHLEESERIAMPLGALEIGRDINVMARQGRYTKWWSGRIAS